jgi:predicted dehydrogenase
MNATMPLGKQRPVRLAFVGLGWIGRTRLLGVRDVPGFECAAIVDADAARLPDVLQAHPGAKAISAFEDCLDEEVDGVVIATPSGLHEEQALRALSRGLAVFCQKPLATTGAGAKRIVASARQVNRLLDVDYCYRHVQGMKLLRERVLGGELGEILGADLVFHNAYAPNAAWCRDRRLAGGGCLLDLGVHLLDLALWLQDFPLLAARHARLFAQGIAITPERPAIEDLAFVHLEQSSGAAVRLACSWNRHTGQDAAIEVTLHGTRASATWRNLHGSFFDFDVSVLRGSRREVLAQGPDEWGPRALRGWINRLGTDNGFDEDAAGLVPALRTIDEIYAL